MPLTSSEYTELTKILHKLLDIVGEDETHELMGLIDYISDIIASHDKNSR